MAGKQVTVPQEAATVVLAIKRGMVVREETASVMAETVELVELVQTLRLAEMVVMEATARGPMALEAMGAQVEVVVMARMEQIGTNNQVGTELMVVQVVMEAMVGTAELFPEVVEMLVPAVMGVTEVPRGPDSRPDLQGQAVPEETAEMEVIVTVQLESSEFMVMVDGAVDQMARMVRMGFSCSWIREE